MTTELQLSKKRKPKARTRRPEPVKISEPTKDTERHPRSYTIKPETSKPQTLNPEPETQALSKEKHPLGIVMESFET